MDAELSQYNLRNIIYITDTKIVDFNTRTSVVETVPTSECLQPMSPRVVSMTTSI